MGSQLQGPRDESVQRDERAQGDERGQGDQRAQRDERERRREREQRLAALAGRQHGVIARRQLLDAGLTPRAIQRRVETGRLHRLHRGVYAVGHERLSLRGHWMAAVFSQGADAVLSHRSAAALWGLMRAQGPIEVTARTGRRLRAKRIVVHAGLLHAADRAVEAGIPVTSVARTLLDLAETLDEQRFERAFEEAIRLKLLDRRALEEACDRGRGRRGVGLIRRLIEEAREPLPGRSPLEERFALFCRERGFPPYESNVMVLGHEVDVYWPHAGLIVELDGWGFHSQRRAFETDRSKDVARQVAGYRAIRVTDRRLRTEADELAAEIRQLFALGARERRAAE